MNAIAAKAVCFKEAETPEWRNYQQQIVANAKAVAGRLSENGFRLVSGGTDNHLLLVDLTNRGLTGKDAEEVLSKAGITLNKNTIPFDTQKPFVTSGIRVGTPCVTSRGMKEAEMKEIVDLITYVLKNPSSEETQKKTLAKVKELCAKFPLHRI
jgi:glycine hydroxymethyltransferase